MKSFVQRFKGLALAGVVVALMSGCRTEDELIGRPWNTPKSWEARYDGVARVSIGRDLAVGRFKASEAVSRG
ncbi:MAG: hypothetical protein EBU81_03690 [Proteobacteria bacterium]|nr:hypothetical protein [Pseudomonadota bacterium]